MNCSRRLPYSQTDYLRKGADFQAREATQGRPVAILVTSRTAVADRAQPAPGMTAIRLEPFSEAQITQWLSVWNDANAGGLAARGLRLLPPHTALEHADLASQPLLLLMLALYDADGNRSPACAHRARRGRVVSEPLPEIMTTHSE